MTWLLYTILSGTFIGFSFFFRKMATKAAGPTNSLIVEGLVYGLIIVGFFVLQKNKGDVFSNPWFAALSAASLFVGGMFLFKALEIGKLSVTNILYVSLSIATVLVLSFLFLKEQLAVKQIIGVVLAIIAVILLRS